MGDLNKISPIEKLIVKGGIPLKGTVEVSGAKNVALKVIVAACLTRETVTIHNVPLISDVFLMCEIVKELGGKAEITDHSLKISVEEIKSDKISLDKAAQVRTSVMFIAPLLARTGKALIPNPGGCRLGARPIDRIINGLRILGSEINYNSEDGYFHATSNGLTGSTYAFEKNTHTGTETMILAAVLAKETTILKNAAVEPEIDELIDLLNKMGAKISRSENNEREITIIGVDKLNGTEFTIGPDRNEIVTFAVAALATKGDITIKNASTKNLNEFLEKIKETNAGIEVLPNGLRFFYKGDLKSTNIITSVYPGFMTDWQSLWAVLMTQANGISTIHETVFENKMGYVHDLNKMGAHIEQFDPKVENPETFYNFNLSDDNPNNIHAVKIHGPRNLHDAIVAAIDLRAGAAIVIASLVASGASTIFGIEKLDRGYEAFEKRLKNLGAKIERTTESL